MQNTPRAPVTAAFPNDTEIALTLLYVESCPDSTTPDAPPIGRVLLGLGSCGGPYTTDKKVFRERIAGALWALHVRNTGAVLDTHLRKVCFPWSTKDGADRVTLEFGYSLIGPNFGTLRDRGMVHAAGGEPAVVWRYLHPQKQALVDTTSQGSPSPKDLREAVEQVCRMSGFDLFGANADLLGDVLIVQPHSKPLPSCESVKNTDDPTAPCTALLVRFNPGSAKSVVVQVKAFDRGNHGVLTRCVSWAPGDPDTTTLHSEASTGIASVIYSAWRDGVLVQEKHFVKIMGFSMSVSLAGGNVTHDDRLSRVSRGRLEHTALTSKGLVVAETVLNDVPSPTEMSGYVRAALPGAPNLDGWFPKGNEGRVEAFERVLALVSGNNPIWIIDPFFDKNAAEALLPRIGNRDAQIHVVTSLPPDRGRDMGTNLIAYLTAHQTSILPYGLVVDRVLTQSMEEGFHDRFLFVEDGDTVRGWILSNSFSGLAVNHPLVMMECPQNVATRAYQEAQRILQDQTLVVTRLCPLADVMQSRHTAVGQADIGLAQAHSIPNQQHVPRSKTDLLSLDKAKTWVTEIGERVRWSPEVDPNDVLRVALDPSSDTEERLQVILAILTATRHGLRETAQSSLLGRIQPADVNALVRWLRSTNPYPAEASASWYGAGLEQIAARQALAGTAPLTQDLANLVVGWCDGCLEEGIYTEDNALRALVYQVLVQTDPCDAFAVASELQDLDFLFGHVGRMLRGYSSWSPFSVDAALDFPSAGIRLLGIALGRDQTGKGRPYLEIAMMNQGSIEERFRLVLAGLSLVPNTADPGTVGALLNLLSPNAAESLYDDLGRFAWSGGAPWIEYLPPALSGIDGQVEQKVLQSVIAGYARPLDTYSSDYVVFGGYEQPRLRVAGWCLARLSVLQPAQPLWDLQMPSEQRQRLEIALRPTTPFSWRKEHGRAIGAWAWCVAWELAACVALRDRFARTETPDTPLKRAAELPKEYAHLAKELWATIDELATELRPDPRTQASAKEQSLPCFAQPLQPLWVGSV